MSDKPLVLIWGATGDQGSSVVNALASSGAFRVRAVTRNPDSEKAKQLAALPGVETIQANYLVEDDILRASQGAYGVYAVTNFWCATL